MLESLGVARAEQVIPHQPVGHREYGETVLLVARQFTSALIRPVDVLMGVSQRCGLGDGQHDKKFNFLGISLIALRSPGKCRQSVFQMVDCLEACRRRHCALGRGHEICQRFLVLAAGCKVVPQSFRLVIAKLGHMIFQRNGDASMALAPCGLEERLIGCVLDKRVFELVADLGCAPVAIDEFRVEQLL
ncbi:hypothetical protein ACEWPM_002740 [Roseovarius sp. S4756]|uniref:hypothetical protein n=1 Tax=Roseovarius maritimus TaxID=3342637 RepID=UPI003727E893